MKKWSQEPARSGNALSPDAINKEMRSAAQSIQALDRHQLPDDCVDEANLKTNALAMVVVTPRYPEVAGSQGEQQAVRDTGVGNNSWEALTYQQSAGGWQPVHTGISLTGFKGGNLFVEWSGNGYVFGSFSDTLHAVTPGNPRYLNFRILVAGAVLVERRGCAYHEAFRVFGTGQFPAGDHEVEFQFRPTSVGLDDALVDTSNNRIMQAHVYSNKVLAIGRFR